MMKNTAAIVLAAGKGTRIGVNGRNKVALEIGNKPMIAHTIANLKKSEVEQIIIVVGFQADSVKSALGNDIDFVVQDPPQGTGDAVKTGISKLQENIDTVLIVYGDDSAFYPPALYQKMRNELDQTSADMVLLTLMKDNPTGLGRIIRDASGDISRIVEEKVASEDEKQIKEINTAMSCIKRSMLEESVNKIKRNPTSGEYYFPDIVEIGLQSHKKIIPILLDDENLWHGVNTQEDFNKVQEKYDRLHRKNE